MCSDHLVVWTCLSYVFSLLYVLGCAGGYSKKYVGFVLHVGLGVVLGFQIASSCEVVYVKVGAGIFALMLFTWCECLKDS